MAEQDSQDQPFLHRLYRPRDLPAVVGLRRTQIAELIKAGKFPKPIPLSDGGRAKAWLEKDLILWQAARDGESARGLTK
jgi:predicted DNA-binding transcriptional regulator AlpA